MSVTIVCSKLTDLRYCMSYYSKGVLTVCVGEQTGCIYTGVVHSAAGISGKDCFQESYAQLAITCNTYLTIQLNFGLAK